MPTSYTREKVDQMLSKWSEQNSETVRLEDVKFDEGLPVLATFESHYPSVRDAVVANNLVYQRKNWITTTQLEEEDYPEHTEISYQRDIYAVYVEKDEDIGYGEVAELLGANFSKVAEMLGPLKHSDPVKSLD